MIKRIEKLWKDEEIFSLLEEEVKRWFKSKFKSFTPAQRYVIPEIHKGENVLLSSPTGTGKTLAAFLSIINELFKLEKEGKLEDRIYAVYVSPLRALNNDIRRNLLEPLKGIEKKAKRKLNIRIAVRTSDTKPYEKSKQTKKPPHILITTPESLAIALNSPRFSENLNRVKWVIVDEIHALAESKRGVHLSLSLERLQYRNERRVIRIGLSATIHPLEEVAKFLVGNGRDCKIAEVNYEKLIEMELRSPVDDFIYTPPEEANKNLYEELKKIILEHETTLIFTNTRSGTERVVYNLKQILGKDWEDKIAAHHSSLSRETRLEVEEKLKKGELKVVVSSTSLELGIDIGNIDVVVLLSSPKSVSRAIQRIGRSGHRFHEKSRGIFIVLDRDDLIESIMIAHNARMRKIDSIRIPRNSLDVLAQHLLGMALEKRWKIEEAYRLVKKAYPYQTLPKSDFMEVLRYLSGSYEELEAKNVYAKVWLDEASGEFGKKRGGRSIYYMNIGTIPTESQVIVKTRTKKFVGTLEEEFAENLMPGDRFVMGGKVYEFAYSRGNVVYVDAIEGGKPTIPAWFSEMLPLAYDLALDIEKFREEIEDLLKGDAKKGIRKIIKKYRVDEKAARAVLSYIREQSLYAVVPDTKKFLVEEYIDEDGLYNYIFHTVAGRKANEALARVFAYLFGQRKGVNVRVTVSDYGFMLSLGRWKRLEEKDIRAALSLDEYEFEKILKEAVSRSELLRRRFRHVATRGLLILRKYVKRSGEMSVGKQQMIADGIMKLLEFYYPRFPLLKEAYREVLEQAMHMDEAYDYLERIRNRELIFLRELRVPSPFAFNLVSTSKRDVIMIEDKRKYIAELHKQLMERLKHVRSN